MTLSIIIVAWNSRKDLPECLESIRQNPFGGDCEVLVVDNGSSDDTAEVVRRGFPEVRLIANEKNSGFAAANNQGITEAQGDYLLLLNPDTVVHAGALDGMVGFLAAHEDVGVVGPLLLNTDGTIQPSTRRFPDFRSALYHSTIFRSLGLFRGHYRQYMMRHFKPDQPTDVDQVMGAAFMTRRSVVDRIGVLDERFFMYYEEVDFCYRVKQAGWRVVILPDMRITHHGGASSAQVPVAARMMVLTSLIQYLRKHRGSLATALFNSLFKPGVLLRHAAEIATAIPTLLLARILSNNGMRQKAVRRLRSSAHFLGRYSGRLLFRT